MGRAAHILKRRLPGLPGQPKWQPWVVVPTPDGEQTEESATRALEVCLEQLPGGSTVQHAIFHQGKIVRWHEGRKNIMAQSRAAPPAIPEDLGSPGHRRFSWWHGTVRVAECVARDRDTAERMIENTVDGWDLKLLRLEEGPPADRNANSWLYLDASRAPTETGQ